MDNFFDNIKNNLDNRPEPEFEESAWLAMEKKMQPDESHHKPVWWWLSWLVIPLLISNGWMFLQLRNANNLSQGFQNSSVEIQSDTIFTSKTIYITDTVYQNTSTVIYQNNLASNFQKNQKIKSPFFQSPPSYFSQDFGGKFLTNHLIFNQSNSFRDGISDYRNSLNLSSNLHNNVELASADNLVEPESEQLYATQLNPLWINFINLNEALPLHLDLQEVVIYKNNKLQKRWRQMTNMMRPKNLFLGVGGGYIYPTNENLSNREGFVMNLQGLISFSKNLRMRLEFSYLRLHLEGSNLDSEFGIPDIPLPNDDYTFEKATTNRPYLKYSLGLQYLFNTKKRIRPYFGIGYNIVAPQTYEVEYEYLDLVGDEVIIPKDFSSQGNQSNQWLINTGLEYQFSKKWRGQIEGFYHVNWAGENNITPNIIGLNTRLLYKF